MNLIDYVNRAHGGQTALAAAIGCQPQLVWQWSRGLRRVPAARCPAIERATGGQVRCEELRPDIDWAVVRRRLPLLRLPARSDPATPEYP